MGSRYVVLRQISPTSENHGWTEHRARGGQRYLCLVAATPSAPERLNFVVDADWVLLHDPDPRSQLLRGSILHQVSMMFTCCGPVLPQMTILVPAVHM